MTFSGNSYIRWRLTVPMERRLNLQVELRTVQRRARLMHAVGRVDYSILEVSWCLLNEVVYLFTSLYWLGLFGSLVTALLYIEQSYYWDQWLVTAILHLMNHQANSAWPSCLVVVSLPSMEENHEFCITIDLVTRTAVKAFVTNCCCSWKTVMCSTGLTAAADLRPYALTLLLWMTVTGTPVSYTHLTLPTNREV